jgi:hypothetical protein
MFREQRVRSALLSTLAALVLLLTSAGAAGASPSHATTPSPAGAPNVTATASCDPIVQFDRNDFSNPTKINNKWLPLVPGTQLTLEGSANPGPGIQPHRVVTTITNVTKVINGVRTVVLWDRDYDAGQLAESELAFFAQDNAGNVWNLGEYPEVYEDGKFVGAPDTWIAGLRDAQAGIHMLAMPWVGTPWYLQGSAPNIDFLDCAKVFKMGQKICVPVNCYDNVLVTAETSPLDQGGGRQLKYHAPVVGIIQVGAVGDPEAETLVLVKLVYLSPHDLAEACKAALKLDKHAYRVSKVYRHTLQAEGPCS